MRNADELFRLITQYEELIKKGNTALTNSFSLTKPPLLARREGVLPAFGTFNLDGENASFRFHGMGCRFEFNTLIVEFDYAFSTFEYKGFEASKLFWFVKSNPQASEALKSRDVFNEALLWLVKNGNLIKADDATIDTYEYILCK